MRRRHERDQAVEPTDEQLNIKAVEERGCLTVFEGEFGDTEAFIRLDTTATPDRLVANER